MDIVCPFCPLRCPAATPAQGRDGQVRPGDPACPLATEAWEQWLARADDALFSGTAPWQRAVEAIAAGPVVEIGGTVLDVPTARESVRLAARLGARLLPQRTRFQREVGGVLQRLGYIGATLGELGMRADSVVMVGDVLDDFPRLLAQYAAAPRCLVIGSVADPSRYPADTLYLDVEPADRAELHYRLARARVAILAGTEADDPLAGWLRDASYVAWTWRSDVLDQYAATQLVGLNSDLNLQRRSVLVSLAENISLQTVSLWLTGLSGELDFASSSPARELQAQAAEANPPLPDVRLWLQPFPHSPSPPPSDESFLVVVGAVDEAIARRADLYVRTAAPGIELAASSYRGDGTVVVRLGVCEVTTRRSAADVLRCLAQDVRQRRAVP